MDHVSVIAMHDELTRQESLDAASEMSRNAVASQGDSKGIRQMVDSLAEAGGQRRAGRAMGELLNDFGGHLPGVEHEAEAKRALPQLRKK